jgi:hypothetical protein
MERWTGTRESIQMERAEAKEKKRGKGTERGSYDGCTVLMERWV